MWSLLFRLIQLIDRVKHKIVSRYYASRMNVKGLHLQYPCRIIGEEYMDIENGMTALSGLRLECIDSYNGDSFAPKLHIGRNVTFNSNCHVGCISEISIEDNVLIGSNVLITDHSHGDYGRDKSFPPSKRPLRTKGSVTIGRETWIGENVCILPNVTIGRNCIIGAGAVITKSVPDETIVVGNPQRIIQRH